MNAWNEKKKECEKVMVGMVVGEGASASASLLLREEGVEIRLDEGAALPGGGGEAVAGDSVSIDQELLKVPENVILRDDIVEKPSLWTEGRHSLWTCTPEKLVEWVGVHAVDVDLAEEVEVLVGDVVVSWPHIPDSVQNLRHSALRLLVKELIAGEAQDNKAHAAVVGQHPVEIQILPSVPSKSCDIDDHDDVSLVHGEGDVATDAVVHRVPEDVSRVRHTRGVV